MKKTAVSEYGFINAKLRSRISRILTDELIRELSGSEDIEAAVQVLASHGFEKAANIWNSTGDIQSLEFELFSNHIKNYRTVMKNTEGSLRHFVNVLTMRPEIENIKTSVRLWYGNSIRQRPISYRSAYIYKDRIYEKIDWNALINAAGYDDIRKIFSNTVYKTVFDNHSIIDKNDRLFELENALDKLYYGLIFEESKQLAKADRNIVDQIISTEIDLQNIGWLIRYRHFYNMDSAALSKVMIPGGFGLNLEKMTVTAGEMPSDISPVDFLKKSYPELSALSISDKHHFSSQAILLEQLLDEARKRRFTRMLAGYPFSIGIILVYLFMSESEFRYISSVLNGKNYKIPQSRIEELQ